MGWIEFNPKTVFLNTSYSQIKQKTMRDKTWWVLYVNRINILQVPIGAPTSEKVLFVTNIFWWFSYHPMFCVWLPASPSMGRPWRRWQASTVFNIRHILIFKTNFYFKLWRIGEVSDEVRNWLNIVQRCYFQASTWRSRVVKQGGQHQIYNVGIGFLLLILFQLWIGF